eukprot:6481998-Amphidinium_carterae.1
MEPRAKYCHSATSLGGRPIAVRQAGCCRMYDRLAGCVVTESVLLVRAEVQARDPRRQKELPGPLYCRPSARQ